MAPEDPGWPGGRRLAGRSQRLLRVPTKVDAEVVLGLQQLLVESWSGWTVVAIVVVSPTMDRASVLAARQPGGFTAR